MKAVGLSSELVPNDRRRRTIEHTGRRPEMRGKYRARTVSVIRARGYQANKMQCGRSSVKPSPSRLSVGVGQVFVLRTTESVLMREVSLDARLLDSEVLRCWKPRATAR